MYSSWSGIERTGGRGEADLLEAAEGLLSSVLAAHLVLCRMALLFPWRDPFYTGAPTFLLEEIGTLASRLEDAWGLLGVSGEAQRQAVKRLIVVVGRQTLEARQRIHKNHERTKRPSTASVREIRSAAALRETEGERG